MDNTPFVMTVNETDLTVLPSNLADFDAIRTADNHFHILKNGKSYQAEIIETDFANKTFVVKINGNTYRSKIADKYDRLIKEIGLSLTNVQKTNQVKSPMPGLVLSILANTGDSVLKGDTLLILEAMKMENVIKAQADGVIKSINVTQGNAVVKGQILIEME